MNLYSWITATTPFNRIELNAKSKQTFKIFTQKILPYVLFLYIFEVFRVNNAVLKMSAGTKDYLNNFIDHINVKSVGARKRTT